MLCVQEHGDVNGTGRCAVYQCSVAAPARDEQTLTLRPAVAVLLQYLRMFVPIRNHKWYVKWSLVSVNVLFNLGLVFAFAFQCIPVRTCKLFNGRSVYKARCSVLGKYLQQHVKEFATFLLSL